MSHPLVKDRNGGATLSGRRDAPAQTPSWPNFQGTPQYIGTSPGGRMNVYIDQNFQAAMQNATDLIADGDRIASQNDAIFGSAGSLVNVIVWQLNGASDGTGGADHASCDYAAGANIEVCASIGNSMRVSALVEAELSECSMGGNLCGVSTGEALSRWCAMLVGNNALSDFATAPSWAQDGYTDFVDQTDPTDQGTDSTGCGMAFLSWLQSQGYALSKIAPAMVTLGDQATFAQVYATLTGDSQSNAWPKFIAAVQALPNGVTTDDPFGTLQPPQLSQATTATARLAGEVFALILSATAHGRSPNDVLAAVKAALHAAPVCEPKSHALRPPSAKGRKM